jgi:dienelactone hydrolase
MSSNPPQENCCAKVTFHGGEPKGSVSNIAGLPCYTTSDFSKSAEKVLIIFTDIFGLGLTNTKLVADSFAAHLGYPVIIPDILCNDPYIMGDDFNEWFGKHPAELTVSILKGFFEKFKTELSNVQFVSGIGYCFGAKYLAHYLTKESGVINVGAFAHPSFVTDEELKAIDKPLIISCAETDTIFTKDLRYKSEDILKENKIHYQFDLYSHTEHGFAVRGDLSIPEVRYAAEKALKDQVDFFKFHEK